VAGYEVLCKKPTGAELSVLRRAVGWKELGCEDSQAGLDGSLFAVSAVSGGELVGAARVVGDGRAVFYIQDVIVHPDFQGRGVGRAVMEKVMEYIASAACDGAVVGLMAATGKEKFYEQFGFHTRPNEREGCGMQQIWKSPLSPSGDVPEHL
jgi:GNAT superfamily N-acetyltransferase